MDATVPPSPPNEPPAAVFPAATDIGPRSDEEARLCARASHPDWLYAGGLLALDVFAIGLHPSLKYNPSQAVRTLGAGFIGFSWGATLGGGVLTLPQCDPNWVSTPPPEGDARQHWPLALAIATLSAASSPILVGITTGGLPKNWTYSERSSRMWISAGTGFIGSLLPYVPILSPATWSAKRELERLRVEPMVRETTGTIDGVYASYTARF